MHIHPSKPDHLYHRFCCDRCGASAGRSENEQEALAQARRTAELYGWRWFHPGWRLICPQCATWEECGDFIAHEPDIDGEGRA